MLCTFIWQSKHVAIHKVISVNCCLRKSAYSAGSSHNFSPIKIARILCHVTPVKPRAKLPKNTKHQLDYNDFGNFIPTSPPKVLKYVTHHFHCILHRISGHNSSERSFFLEQDEHNTCYNGPSPFSNFQMPPINRAIMQTNKRYQLAIII